DRVRGEHAGSDIADWHADTRRTAVGFPRQVLHAPHALQNGVVGGLPRPRTGLPEARDRAVDECWIDLVRLVVIQAEAIHRARPKVLDQDIRGAHETAQRLQAVRRLQVERDAALVAIDAEEVAALA